jgi:hypothetical protein
MGQIHIYMDMRRPCIQYPYIHIGKGRQWRSCSKCFRIDMYRRVDNKQTRRCCCTALGSLDHGIVLPAQNNTPVGL